MCSDLEERILIKAQRRKLRAAGIAPPYAAHSTKPVVSIPKREREAKQTEVQSKGVVHKSRSSSRSRSPGSRSSAAAAHEREREQRWMSPTHSPSKSSSHRAKNYGRARQAVIQAAAEAARDVAAEEPAVPTEQHFAVGSPAYALRNALQKSLFSSSSSSLRWASRGKDKLAAKRQQPPRAAHSKSRRAGLLGRQPKGSALGSRRQPPRPSSARAMRKKLSAEHAARAGLTRSPYKVRATSTPAGL